MLTELDDAYEANRGPLLTHFESAQIDNQLESWLGQGQARIVEWRKAPPRDRLFWKAHARDSAKRHCDGAGKDANAEAIADEVMIDLHAERECQSILTIVALTVLTEIVKWIVRKILERRQHA